MSTTNDGGPVPEVFDERRGETVQHGSAGMSLRDHFAGQALPAVYADYCASARTIGFDEGWKMGVALDAYAMADAMLAARDHIPN